MQVTEADPDAPFFIILNAGSGHAETEVRRSTIEEILTQAGRRFHLLMVDDAASLAGIAQRAVADARAAGGIVVAAGGDGTINTVAHATVASGCPFGVLPQGTFNYFGRTHGIPEDLGDAVRALLTSRIHPVQIGLVNDRIFLVNASIGLYPKLLEEREAHKKQYGRSRLVALWSAIMILLRPHRQLRISLEIDGQTRMMRTPSLFVGNNRLQMEQVGMPPLAEALEEGELAAILPKPVGPLGLLGLLLRGLFGRLDKAENVIGFSFRQMRVRTPSLYGKRSMKVATDGEVTHLRMPLEFRVLEGHLNLLKPDAAETVSTPDASLAEAATAGAGRR
jgi:diacylglycerol kinase family enzyme